MRINLKSFLRYFTGTLALIISIFSCNSAKAQTVQLEVPEPRSYYMPESPLGFWLSSEQRTKKASEWIALMEASDTVGLRPYVFRVKKLKESMTALPTMDSAQKKAFDWELTGSVLLFMKQLHQGNLKLDYDEVLPNRDSLYARLLLQSDNVNNVATIANIMDCRDPEYLAYKRYLNDSVTKADTLKYKSLVLGMNYRRYISFINAPEYVLVNIPENEAKYYRNDTLILSMRTAVGKTENQTPRFASLIYNVETYPFWNVPRSIATKEILPMVQKDRDYLDENNFEVVDAAGNVVPDTSLHWSRWDKRTFPYYFRQSTGADNALGVLKFNVRNPYSVYLHATAWPGVFSRDNRFVSHGCIRLEKPFDLAHELLRGQIDIAELKSGKKGKKPQKLKLKSKVSVFVIYAPVRVNGGRVEFLRDVYNLVK